MNNIDKAQQIVELNLCHVLSRTTDGKIKTVLVPGSQGKQYMVILKRHPGGIVCECILQGGNMGNVSQCPSGTRMCYHSIAAVMMSLMETKQWFRIFKNDDLRVYFQRLNKPVFTVRKKVQGAIPVNFVISQYVRN